MIRGSLFVLGFFFSGIILGRFRLAPDFLIHSGASMWMLYILLLTAGMGVGFDLKALSIIRNLKGKILLVPLGAALGSLGGSALAWLLLPGIGLVDCLAVGAGFGYYSLATVILTEMGDAALGSVALLSNMIREIVTLTLAPVLIQLAGRLGPVMSGGAGAMDTCLPVIAKYSGERYAILAVFSGMALTLLVPILVPAIMALK